MTPAPLDPPWSPQQVGWLQAMGFSVYLDRDLVPEPAPAAQARSAPPALEDEPRPSSQARPERRTDRPSRPAPAAPATAPTEFRPQGAAPHRPRRVGMPDRLQLALLRASGCNPSDPQTRTLMESWPLEQLRADPAAKRALWPSLRALRKGQGTP